MLQARLFSVALVSLGLGMGCGGSGKVAHSPDEVVALDDKDGGKPGGASGATAEAASSPEVADAMKAIEAKRFAEAKTLLSSAISKNPRDAQAQYYMGVAESAPGGNLEHAVKSYESAIELDSKLIDAYVNLSALKLELKDGGGALAIAERGLAVAKKQPDLVLNRALALEAMGKLEEARVAYGEAVTVRPDDFTLRVSFAQLLAQAKKKQEALLQLSAMRECGDAKLLALGAIVALNLEAPADCVALMDRAVKVSPQAGAYVRRGICRDKLKDAPGATDDFRKAIERDPKFAPAHFYLAQVLKATDKSTACKELALAAEYGGAEGVGPGAKKEQAALGCN